MLEGRQIFMSKFTNKMENCIGSVRRALRYVEALRSDSTAPPQNRLQRRAIEASAMELTDVRNIVEHLEGYIARGIVAVGQPVALCLTADEKGVQLGGEIL